MHAMAHANCYLDEGSVVVSRNTERMTEIGISTFYAAMGRVSRHRIYADIAEAVENVLKAWSDILPELKVRILSSVKHPKGKLMGATVYVTHAPLAEIAQAAASQGWVAAVRAGMPDGKSGHTVGPSSAGEAPARRPADIVKVAALPKPAGFASTAQNRILGKLPPLPVGLTDDDDIAF